MTPPRSRRPRFAGSFFTLCGLAGVLGACHKDPSPSQIAAPAPSASQVGANDKLAPIPDADIAKAVERHFQEENMLRSERVQVAVTQGVARLSGSVSNLLAKERAVAVTETIRGIRSVVDELIVTPIPRTDEQLKTDVARAIQTDVATHPYTIGVVAKDGKVTLTGTADSWQQKTLFADVAKRVRGVRALENAVVLHYANVRADGEIATDVRHRIANDIWLDGDILSVTVSGHMVHVTGVVASAARKTRARADGWVAGVDAVDDDGVFVDAYARDDQRSISDYSVKSDADIAQAVRDAFRLDPRLATLTPQVTVQNGAVVLRGTVDSPSARRAAASDAKDTLGVWFVRNEVVAQPAGQPTDADIERAVKGVLAEDPFLVSGKGIQVTSANGTVSLKGTIEWGSERFDLLSDVASVPGVYEIDDGLVVKRPAADIKTNIEDRVYWDPMVARGRVSVAVTPDGVATLTGSVDAWSEIKAATDDALWGGATRVVNLINLKNHPSVAAP